MYIILYVNPKKNQTELGVSFKPGAIRLKRRIENRQYPFCCSLVHKLLEADSRSNIYKLNHKSKKT